VFAAPGGFQRPVSVQQQMPHQLHAADAGKYAREARARDLMIRDFRQKVRCEKSFIEDLMHLAIG